MPITLTVHGNLLSKANSRIVRTYGSRPMVIKKPEAIYYTTSALKELKTQLRGHQTYLNPCRIDITIWYSTKRPDLDVSLIQDILEKAEVYKNDRQVYEIHAYKQFDKTDPRLTVTVTEL